MTTKPFSPRRKAQQASTLLVAALDERWKNYRTQVKICRREFSEEAVHDLRVAARRLLAALDIVRALDPHPRIQKTRGFLKDQLDDLDDLRDVQVMLVEISETTQSLPGLQPFEAHLQEREKHLLRLAQKQIRTLMPSELKKRIEKITDSLKKSSARVNLHAQLFQAVDNDYSRVMQAFGQVDASQSGTIHRLRLDFKKFRYMTEIVHPLFSGHPESHLKRMHDYQSAMGDIQDIETFLNALVDFSESGASSFELEPIRHFYEKRHAGAVAAFLEDKGEIVIFWRAASDQPFPWEQKHDLVHHPSRHRRRSGDVRRRRQPALLDQQGPPEDAVDRARTEGTGGSDRFDLDQSLPASDPDSAHLGEEV
jgi:CHAD domain-containing protein